MMKTEAIQALMRAMDIDPGDEFFWVYKTVPLAVKSQASEWYALGGRYLCVVGEYIVVEGRQGREAFAISEVLRIFKPRQVATIATLDS